MRTKRVALKTINQRLLLKVIKLIVKVAANVMLS